MTLMDRYQCEGVVSLTSHWFQCYGNCSNSGVSSPGVSHTCLAHGVDPEAWESRVSCRCMQKAAGRTPLQMCFPLRSYNCPPSSLLHYSPASQGSISLWLLEEGFILRSPWDPWFPRSPLKSEPPSVFAAGLLSSLSLPLHMVKGLPGQGHLPGDQGLLPALGHPGPLHPAQSLRWPAGRDGCEARWAHAHRTWLQWVGTSWLPCGWLPSLGRWKGLELEVCSLKPSCRLQ